MKSKNHLSISGVVAKLEPVPERNCVKFFLVHNFGGGNPPLFLPCFSSQNYSFENGENLRIEAHLRAVHGRTTAFVSKVFTS